MTPTLKNLKYLIALKKTNHFSKAASECFVSPSTFSAGISKLEQDLQVLLVERDNKHVLFTPIGKRIVNQAILTIADLAGDKCNKAAKMLDAHVVSRDKIFEVECDIFAPCALGAVINKETVEKLNCKILCGGANNQLSTSMIGYALKDKGIINAPDFIVNAGGVIYACKDFEIIPTNDFHIANILDRIYDRTMKCLLQAKENNMPTNLVAELMAAERFKSGNVEI